MLKHNVECFCASATIGEKSVCESGGTCLDEFKLFRTGQDPIVSCQM